MLVLALSNERVNACVLVSFDSTVLNSWDNEPPK